MKLRQPFTSPLISQMPKILGTPEIKVIDQITIGRSDLSKSIGKQVDDQEIIKKCKEITK